MLCRMIVPRALAALLALVLSGFWAGSAAAQTAGEGEWFDETNETAGAEAADSESKRPVLRIRGDRPYDPPPPDFRSDDAPASTAESVSDAEGDEPPDPEAQERALREFSPYLTPYGGWIDDPVYGRVWVPAERAVGVGFAPYVSGGHWELTVDGDWLWVSDYPFGWVTFHYGRWVWLPAAHWAWVPGYRYAHAWVDFRVGATGYIGWGPLAPRWGWRHGVFVSIGVRRPAPFIFCPTAYVFGPSLHRHVIRDRHRVHSIAAHTHRYRPRPHRLGPTPAEARIPERALPPQRTIARPRVITAAGSVNGVRRFESSSRSSQRSFSDRSRSLDRSRTLDVRSRRATPAAPPPRAFGDRAWREPRFDQREFAPRERRASPRRGAVESRRAVQRPPTFNARTPRASSGRERSTLGSRQMVQPRRAHPARRATPAPATAPGRGKAVSPAPATRRSDELLRPGAFRAAPPKAEKRATDRKSPARGSPARGAERRTRSRDTRGGRR